MSPPRDWVQNSQNFHDFIMTEVTANTTANTADEIDFNNLRVSIDHEFDILDVADIIDENKGAIIIDKDITPQQLAYETYAS
jgi:hypothetical protein